MRFKRQACVVAVVAVALCVAHPAEVAHNKGLIAVPGGDLMKLCADVKAEGFVRLSHVAADLDGCQHDLRRLRLRGVKQEGTLDISRLIAPQGPAGESPASSKEAGVGTEDNNDGRLRESWGRQRKCRCRPFSLS